MPINANDVQWDDSASPQLDASNIQWDENDIQWDEDEGMLDTLGQFGRNVGGAALGLADIATGAVTALPAMAAGSVKRAFGVPAEQVRKEIQEAMRLGTLSNVLEQAGFSPRENQSYQYMMKPFEALQEGIESGVEALGGGEEEKLLADIASVAIPLPFAGRAARGVQRGLELIDPALRDQVAPRPQVEPTVEPVQRESTAGNVTVRWEEQPMAQAEMFEPINPYDVAGGVTDALAGRERTIGELEQGDLFDVAETTPAREVPLEVPQPFREAVQDVPVLRDVVKDFEAPVAVPEPPSTRNKPPIEQITENIPGLNKEMQMRLYDDQPPEFWVEQARGEKDGRGDPFSVYGASGANLAAQTRRSTLVKAAYTYWNAAEGQYQKNWRSEVVPVEKDLAHLSKKDRQELAGLMKSEMFERGALDTTVLTPRAQKAYTKLRESLVKAGEEFNRGREIAGLPPVDLKEFYMASRWRGNYKMEVRDADGKLVWFLREPTKIQLNRSVEALKKAVPGLNYKAIEPSFRRGSSVDQLEAGYLEMLKILDENDPRVEALKSVYEEHIMGEGVPALGMPFHAERKANVRGFIGDKPGRTAEENAVELLNSQIQYMKNVYKWAAQQEAVAKTKKLVSDEQLQREQPNNVEYVREYSKNALGYGTQKDLKNIESLITESVGVDRAQAMNALNIVRGFFYTVQLGLGNLKATGVQLLQPLFMIPAHMDMMTAGFKFNPITTYMSTLSDSLNLLEGKKASPEVEKAIRWAQENGVLSINVLDDIKNIGESDLSRKAKQAMNINQVWAERMTRTFSFVGAVNHLLESGLRGEQLYRTAEAMTNRVMVDYRKFEQPMWMEKGGLAGRSAGTLKTFLNNQYHQLLYYWEEAKRGLQTGNYSRVAPLVTMVGLQYLLAGQVGMYGMQTVGAVWDHLIKPLLGPEYADKDWKSVLLSNLPDWSAYGLLSSSLDINLHGSLSQGVIGGGESLGEVFAPFLSYLGKTGAALGSAALNPTSGDKWAQALYEAAPPHIKGLLENIDPRYTSAAGISLNPRDLNKGMYKRDKYEKALRVMGATSLREMATKDRAFAAQQREMSINEAKKTLKDAYVKSIESDDMETAEEVVTTLLRWMGPEEIGNYLVQGVRDVQKERARDVVQRLLPESLKSVGSQRQYQRVQEVTGGPR